MASMRLPWDMEEEILSRLPPLSLARFRAVCQHWNALFNDNSFINKHLSRSHPQFIFLAGSKIYSIHVDLSSVDPTIELRELPSDFSCQPMNFCLSTITACDGLLFHNYLMEGVAVWNPWLRQVGWIEYEDKPFHFCGVGYDNSREEKGYKILGYLVFSRRVSESLKRGYDRVAIFECASRGLKFLDAPFEQWPCMHPVSLNGNLYWVAHNAYNEYFIRSFDFSMEIFKPFCLLPRQKTYRRNELVLGIFKGDRFSLLNQCLETNKVEIWVTKEKINDREKVVWINLMTLPTTNLPKLVNKLCGISYFISNKTLILCCAEEDIGAACVYIVREGVCKKIPIDSGTDWFSHYLYFPNLIPVPLELRPL